MLAETFHYVPESVYFDLYPGYSSQNKSKAVFKKIVTLCLYFFQKFRPGVKDLQVGKELCVPQGTEKKAHKANIRKKSINILELEMLKTKKKAQIKQK